MVYGYVLLLITTHMLLVHYWNTENYCTHSYTAYQCRQQLDSNEAMTRLCILYRATRADYNGVQSYSLGAGAVTDAT